MKKILLLALVFAGLSFLQACVKSTTETTIAKNGSGTVVTYVDMSGVIELATQMGKDVSQEVGPDKVVDTMIYFKDKLAEIEKKKGKPLTADEKEVYGNSKMQVKMNIKEKILNFTITSKFSKLIQLPITTELAKKAYENSPLAKKDSVAEDYAQKDITQDATDKTLEKSEQGMSFNIRDGLIEYAYDEKKHQVTEEDEKMLQSMEMMKSMLGEMPVKVIYNLPRPSKSVTGKAKTEVSADKKKVTITYDLLDTFKDPSVQSYRIEY